MSSSISSQSSAHKLSGGYQSSISPHSMGSRFSSGLDRHSIGSSDYANHPSNMGSGASHTSGHFPRDSGYQSQGYNRHNPSKFGNSEEDHQRHQARCGSRPLPGGPGPLMPPGMIKRSRKKPESIQAKGPVKANHLIQLNGTSHRTEPRNVTSPLGNRSLSRIKSRSMSDVRDTGNNQMSKPTSDRVMRDAGMKKVKKTFSISRSPSFENIAIGRNGRKRDEPAILDRLSKLSTDESARKTDNSKDFHSIKQDYLASSTKADFMNNMPAKSRLSQYQLSLSPDSSTLRHNGGLRDDRTDKTTFSSRQRNFPRQSSDSAYESNGSTGSSSGHSSPGMPKDLVSKPFFPLNQSS